MTPIRTFRDLDVWNRGMDLVVGVYELTAAYPRHELYGLTDQTRRAAVSIPANIAEGHGRMYRGEYVHHAAISRGSTCELITCLEIGRRLKYVSDSALEPSLTRADDVAAMTTRLIHALRRSPNLKW
jgi:four helix bundle protein